MVGRQDHTRRLQIAIAIGIEIDPRPLGHGTNRGSGHPDRRSIGGGSWAWKKIRCR